MTNGQMIVCCAFGLIIWGLGLYRGIRLGLEMAKNSEAKK